MRTATAWLVLVAALLAGCAGTTRGGGAVAQDGDGGFLLVYRGQARNVNVVGDFNNWNPTSHPFRKSGSREWSCQLRVPPGRYLYLLRVETDEGLLWTHDTGNPHRERDESGRLLSVLQTDNTVDDAVGR